jgi:hypothetical protein
MDNFLISPFLFLGDTYAQIMDLAEERRTKKAQPPINAL